MTMTTKLWMLRLCDSENGMNSKKQILEDGGTEEIKDNTLKNCFFGGLLAKGTIPTSLLAMLINKRHPAIWIKGLL